MNLDINYFRELTFIVFFLYIFFETKIYLALWAAIFDLLRALLTSFSNVNMTIYKGVISSYIIIVLIGYLYHFREVLTSKKGKNMMNVEWERLSKEKAKQRRIGIAILLLILTNCIVVFLG